MHGICTYSAVGDTHAFCCNGHFHALAVSFVRTSSIDCGGSTGAAFSAGRCIVALRLNVALAVSRSFHYPARYPRAFFACRGLLTTDVYLAVALLLYSYVPV